MSNKKTKTTNFKEDTTFDPNIIGASNWAVDRARGLAEREYTPYTGQRIAPLSSYEQEGIDLTKQGAKGFDEAFDSGGLDKYMTNLADPVIREANRDFEAQRQQQRAQAVQQGAFGGSRMALQEGSLAGRHMENLSDIRGAAFDKAIGVFQNDQARKIGAGAQLGNMGAVERVIRQAQNDFDYGQFLEARDWDVNNLMPLLQTLQSAPKNVHSKGSSVSTEKGDKFGQLVGLAATVAGAFFTGGASLALGAGLSAVGGMGAAGASPSGSTAGYA